MWSHLIIPGLRWTLLQILAWTFPEFVKCESHSWKPNRPALPKTVLYRPITKQPQVTCISYCIPTNLVAIAWAWHRDWPSVSGCQYFANDIYTSPQLHNPPEQALILALLQFTNMFNFLKSTAAILVTALLAPLVASQGVAAPPGFNM